MAGELAWDLGSSVSYTTGGDLECKITIIAPEDGTYYLLGALYTTQLEYVPGTLFGVLLPSGEIIAVNSLTHATTWELEEDGEQEQDCKFIFDRTDTILGLFLMKMAGTEASWENDTVVDSITVSLSGPVMQEPLDISALIMLMIPIMMIGMMVKVVAKV